MPPNPGKYYDKAWSVAVSPSGDRVFVTGESDGGMTDRDYATLAYNAATGAKLWAQRYNGPAGLSDTAVSVAASPSGGTVFVTGFSFNASDTNYADYATLAYNAATGAKLWAQR